jgi:hypothetical protein
MTMPRLHSRRRSCESRPSPGPRRRTAPISSWVPSPIHPAPAPAWLPLPPQACTSSQTSAQPRACTGATRPTDAHALSLSASSRLLCVRRDGSRAAGAADRRVHGLAHLLRCEVNGRGSVAVGLPQQLVHLGRLQPRRRRRHLCRAAVQRRPCPRTLCRLGCRCRTRRHRGCTRHILPCASQPAFPRTSVRATHLGRQWQALRAALAQTQRRARAPPRPAPAASGCAPAIPRTPCGPVGPPSPR